MEDKRKIKFEVLDFLPGDMNYFKKKAIGIAKFVSKEPKLIQVLSEFLLLFIDKIDFDTRFKKWKKELKLIEEYYDKANLDKLVEQLYEAFSKTSDIHIDKLRGLIFEYLIENHYKTIYSLFSHGCKVTIDGIVIEYICSEDIEKNRNTVDVAGYSVEKSEFYEVKVGPDGFKDNVIKYLNLLNKIANEKNISKEIMVGCMTLETKEKLNIKLKGLKEDCSQLKIYGRNELINIFQSNAI